MVYLQHAAELLFTGRLISAEEALKLGLVTRIDDDAVNAAREIAKDICDSAPIAIKTLVQTLRNQQNSGLESTFLIEASAQSICYGTRDLVEGVKALQEKRNPSFTNQ